MEEWETRLADALELVDRSQETVASQTRRLEAIRAAGRPTRVHEDMLALFEAALERRQKRLGEILAAAPIGSQFRPR